ncbi:MAG: GTP cyclohydrolase I [Turicibacter sp.]
MIDKEKIETSIRDILIALGENPMREGLVDTPTRVANMYAEVFEGINYTNDDIVAMYNKCFKEDTDIFLSNGVIWVKDIECFSFCEHHMALIYDLTITIAYKPKNKVIGLSKIARISDMVCKRLQIQERIGSDIYYILNKITDSDDILIKITGKHGCMTTRGIKKSQATTCTVLGSGIFSNYTLKEN